MLHDIAFYSVRIFEVSGMMSLPLAISKSLVARFDVED
jgi:hypothetical protein